MDKVFAVVVASVALTLAAADPKPTAGIPVAGGIVVSPDLSRAFLPVGGGVEAVELATGKTAWASKDAPRLAGASGAQVFGWAADAKAHNTFRVVVLDAATGKTLARSEPIALPEWADVNQPHGFTFQISAQADGDAIRVAWRAGSYYAGGAAPPPEVEEAARRNESGLVSIDAKSGKVAVAKGKPGDADFASGTEKPGGYEFQVSERQPGVFGGPPLPVSKVGLVVLKGGKQLWTRELTGRPFSPPPP